MSFSAFDNYSSVRSSLKLLIKIFVHFQNWELSIVKHTIISSKCNAWSIYVLQLKILYVLCTRDEQPLFVLICSSAPMSEKNSNVLICLDFSTVVLMAELINPAVMYYLSKSLRDSQCDVDTECWVHSLSLWQMRMVNFPVTSTAFVPCEYSPSVGQAQLCTALSLMLESIISQLLGRLTDVCCTNKGFQLESGG